MIELLDHSAENVAGQIHDVFQLSYRIEAGLVGSSDFPPLRRTASLIRSSNSQFLGERIGADLVSVVEFSLSDDNLSIDSLVVHPHYFRRGLARKLLQSLLARDDWKNADVETAAANAPALILYEKLGFLESKRWQTVDGIEKVQLMRGKTGPEDG
jgi:ribosomal protein S18 acetylase RimI-like enzyme